MIEAISVRVKYDTKDEDGETRRERNERFGTDSPPLVLPPVGAYLWEIYFEISSRVQRVRDGICIPISPTEFAAWVSLSQRIVYPNEYDILCGMDDAFVEATNVELAEYRAREQQKREDEQSKKVR